MSNEEAIIDIRENIQPIIGGKSLDIAISDIEKQIPKKPTYEEIGNVYGALKRTCAKCGDVCLISEDGFVYGKIFASLKIFFISALLPAIEASFKGSGFCSSPESANTNIPFYPYSQFGTTIKKNAETKSQSSRVLIICSEGLNVLAVE